MISFVRGSLSAVYENRVEIDTGSFGLEIFVPTSVLGSLPKIDEDLTLYTYFNVKEDEMSLYGFLTRDEGVLFRQLITVNGIGPKVALQILSSFTPSDLRLAILSEDAKTISRAPGVGTKTAQRLIMELKDKISPEDTFRTDAAVSPAAFAAHMPEDGSAKSDAVMALVSLGYTHSEALKAVSAVDTEGRDTEDILKDALRVIAL